MSTRKQELQNSIKDLRDELSKFERELEELDTTVKKGDIVRIIDNSPVSFTTDTPFVVGAYCKVLSVGGFKNRITIKLHKSVYIDSNVCMESQVELVWSS